MDIGYVLKPLLENEKNNILGIEAEINETKSRKTVPIIWTIYVSSHKID